MDKGAMAQLHFSGVGGGRYARGGDDVTAGAHQGNPEGKAAGA